MAPNKKTVVITGATAGVGREVARLFAKNGYDVALLARGEAGLEATARDVEEMGQRCLVVATDVATFAAVDAAASEVESVLGPIDVWINNAMTTVFSPLSNVESDDFERAIHVTFLGQVWGTMAALSRMRTRDAGTIINVGSALAFIGIPLQSAYCASKFACRGFFEATRAELLHERSNIHLCMVHLPAMNTPQFDWCETTMDKHPMPVPPIYQPEVAAQAILKSAIDGKRSRIVGSWNKMLVALDSLMPGVGNHYASLGAWNAQLTKQPVAPDRPSNLRAPADNERDYGGHGSFDDQARGVRDPHFLVTLPKVAVTYCRATARSISEFIEVRRRGDANKAQVPADTEPSMARSHNAPNGGAVKPDQAQKDGTSIVTKEETSLDVLANEDVRLMRLFEDVALVRGESVEERYAFGNLAKEILRHLAVRQAALVDVASVISSSEVLSSLHERIVERMPAGRRTYDEVLEMARGVQPMGLNEGQDFSGAFNELERTVRDEIFWEVSEAIPTIRVATSSGDCSNDFREARRVRSSAPTRLNPKGTRWHEVAPGVSRLYTFYEHLKDFPRSSRDWRSS